MRTSIKFHLLPAILSQQNDTQQIDGSLSESLTLKVCSTKKVNRHLILSKFPAVDEIHISRFSGVHVDLKVMISLPLRSVYKIIKSHGYACASALIDCPTAGMDMYNDGSGSLYQGLYLYLAPAGGALLA